MLNSKIVITDPFSSGALLASELKKRGHALIAVLSKKVIPAVYRNSFNAEYFDRVIDFEDHDSCLNELRENRVAAVIAGSEPGVPTADYLAETLGLESNNSGTSILRRNKYEMQKQLRTVGVPSIQQQLIRKMSEIPHAVEHFDRWPLVVKPLESAGSDGVRYCKSPAEIQAAIATLLNYENALGFRNSQVLIQECLEGDEYVVDFVVRNAIAYPCAIWKYEKRKTVGGNFIYLSVSLLESYGIIQQKLINYGKKAIHALGVQIGAAHCEIMMTPRGPVLVEMGARIHGGKAAEVGGLCTGKGQIDLVIDAYLSPDGFHDKTETPYQLKQVCKICFLTSKHSGTILEYRGIDRIRELKSFYEFPFLRPIGASLEVTTDLFNAPGVVILVNSDPESLERDYCELRALDTRGMFLV